MARLTQRDLASLQQCTLDIHTLRDSAAFPSRVLAALQRVVPVEYASYMEINLRTARGTPVLEPAVDLWPESDRIFASYIHEHPLITYHRRTHGGRAVKVSDFLTRHPSHLSYSCPDALPRWALMASKT